MTSGRKLRRGRPPPARGLLLIVAGALMAGCASTADLAAQATEAEGTACTSAELQSYSELFNSVAEEAMADAELLQRAIDGEESLALVSAAARRASVREIALRRENIPECLALPHLRAIESAQAMSEAAESLLQGESEAAEVLLRRASDDLTEGRRLLEQQHGQ